MNDQGKDEATVIGTAQLNLKDIKKDTSVFSKNHEVSSTRRKPDLVKEFKCRTKRFEKSSLPYLYRLLNLSKVTTPDV